MPNNSLSPLAVTLVLTSLTVAVPTLAQGRFDRPIFFQEGQEMMEREIQRLQQQQQQLEKPAAVEHPSQLLTVDDGKLRWQKYLFRAGGFSVWMPQGIQSKETVVLDLNVKLGKLAFDVFSTQPPKWRFVAAYSEALNATQAANPDTFLSAVQEGIVAQTKFTPLSDRSFIWQGFPSRELILQGNKETISFQIYLIKQRVCVLAAGQKHEQVLSEEVANFFASLRLLN